MAELARGRRSCVVCSRTAICFASLRMALLRPTRAVWTAILVTVALIADAHRASSGWQSALYRSPDAIPCPNIRALPLLQAGGPSLAGGQPVATLMEYACDPQDHLAALFRAVTAGAADDLNRGKRWIRYVQSINLSAPAPLDADGSAIYHPIWLLEHRAMDCSQTARLLVDGFISEGIPARVLQLNGHVSAEFHANGKWRLAEADVLADGEFVADADGEPASVDEILANPALSSSVHPYREHAASDDDGRDRFRMVFEPTVYPQSPLETPYVIRKVSHEASDAEGSSGWYQDAATVRAVRLRRHYHGWNDYVFCSRADAACVN